MNDEEYGQQARRFLRDENKQPAANPLKAHLPSKLVTKHGLQWCATCNKPAGESGGKLAHIALGEALKQSVAAGRLTEKQAAEKKRKSWEFFHDE